MILVYDPASSPLEGRALIESSAGTGKTYAIAERYVRLLLERKLRVEQMLVVTFTHAAVAELTDRIRKKIKDKLSECRTAPGDAPEGKAGRDRESDRRLLEDALRTFDLASIQTIHGFCGRALQDNAFESASLFDTEVVPDTREIVRRAVNDFFLGLAFREEPGWDPLLRRRVFDQIGKPEDALSLVGKCLGNPFLNIEPEETGESPVETDPTDYAVSRKEFFEAFSNARDAVTAPGGKDKIVTLLLDGSLSGTTHNPKHLPRHADDLFTWIMGGPSLPAPEKLQLFCHDRFKVTKAAEKKGLRAPAHPAFERFTELRVASERLEPILERLASAWVVRLRTEMLRKARAAIRGLKGRKNVRSYDDLLLDLHEALFGPPGERRRRLTAHGERLARALKSRYKAVLIDEFQDTDPVQYEIFTGIFSDVEEDALLLVGDPKQSIYRFRNADVFAYRQAREDVPEDRRFRLDRNYRSVPSLVRAVNAVFEGARDPFVFDWIPFESVKSNRKEGDGLGGAETGGPASLVFWHVEGKDLSEKGKEIAKGAIEDQVLEATAGEIVRLLNGGSSGTVTLGDKGDPLLPKDVAVLVRTNQEARQVRDSLVDRGVPCVLYCSESIFATLEAETFRTFLAGVANPADERKVRAALATDLFGLSGDDLDDLMGREEVWAERIRDFIRYRETWEEKGIAAMCRGVFSSGGVRSRMLSSPGGERALTNILHLAELLQEFEACAGGVERTVAWLDARKAEATSKEEGATAAEEHQLRLETDSSAVKVVTIHKCKGLQYPVVFLPFAWKATGKDWRDRIEKKEGIFYHEDDVPPRAVRRVDDIPDEKRELADREELAENSRLFYVALTRAVARCYVVWGGVKDAERTGAAWVLHGKRIDKSRTADFQEEFKKIGDDAILADLKALAESTKEGTAAEPAIRVEPLPSIPKDRYVPAASPDAVGLTVRMFPPGRRIALRFGETSFTALSKRATDPGAVVDPEAPDRDTDRPGGGAFVVAPDPRSIHAFPAGAKAGIFFHELLEEVDFAATEGAIFAATRNLLPLHGLDAGWAGIVAKQVSLILSLPLEGEGERFTLSSVSRADRLSEVRFAFPVRKFDDRGTAPESFEGISFSREEGILKGAIDLVCRAGERFYLLDWKSNRLGPDADHYSIERLGEEMSSRRYRLQADIYAVALHLYLKRRLPGYAFDRHFGGTFYLFFRGIDSAQGTGSGVWFDRPDEGRVERISKALGGAGWAE